MRKESRTPVGAALWPHRPWYRRLLTPPALWRLDRFLVTQYPLVWRTRILFFVFGSAVVANGALLWAGSVYPVAADGLPSLGDVANIMTVLYGIGAVVLLLWGYLQYRSPLHELSLRRYGLLTALYAACIFSVLVNPVFFVVPLVNRMADVVTDGQFRADFAFHEANGFWVCSPNLTEPFAERREEIVTALARYGVESEFGYSSESLGRDGYFCGDDERVPMPSLMTSGDNPQPIWSLRETLESIREARAFANDGAGAYAHHVHHLPRYVFLSLALGALLTLLVSQENVWRRTFDPYGNRFSLPRLVPPLPRFMQRLDDHLVANRPLLWSTRAHTFAYFTATFGIVLIVALLGLVGAFVEDPSELVQAMMDNVGQVAGLVLLLAVGGILSGAWAVYQRRIDLRFRSVSDNQRALLLYLLITSVLPLMAVAVMALAFPDPSDLAAFAIFFLTGSWFATSIVYVAKHTGARDVVLSLLASVGALVGSPSSLWSTKRSSRRVRPLSSRLG